VGWLPQIFGSKYLLSIVVAVVITIFMYVYLNYSKQGYEISVVGESENTAKYVGIKVEKVIIRTMLLSGALCGLVGLLLVGGINHTVTTTIAGGQGFTCCTGILDVQVQSSDHGILQLPDHIHGSRCQ